MNIRNVQSSALYCKNKQRRINCFAKTSLPNEFNHFSSFKCKRNPFLLFKQNERQRADRFTGPRRLGTERPLVATVSATLRLLNLFVHIVLVFYLLCHLSSSMSTVTAFKIKTRLQSSSNTTVRFAEASLLKSYGATRNDSNESNKLKPLMHFLNREIRAPSNDLFSYGTPNSTLTILAILPDENGPSITLALRDAQSRWESSGRESAFRLLQQRMPLANKKQMNFANIKASDFKLEVNSHGVNNDTNILLSSICEWIGVHNPSMILSLLDRERNYYVSQVAQHTGIPFVSWTQNYRSEITAIGDDHPLSIDLKEIENYLFGEISAPPDLFNTFKHSNLLLSLDPPIQTLADATFEVLRAQYWFDAILIVDDSIVSDHFVRRLDLLCSNAISNGDAEGDFKQSDKRQTFYQNAAKKSKFEKAIFHSDDDNFAWSNFKKSSLRKSHFRIDALGAEDASSDAAKTVVDVNVALPNDELTDEQLMQQRKMKEASLLDVWKNFIVIRLSRSLNHKQFYLRMAEIQTTHRRVVLIHADWSTTQRVIRTARELGLFNGDKIWMLLDGLLGQQKQNLFANSADGVVQPTRIDLPNGMLALRNRRRLVYDANLLDSIIELVGRASLRLYHNPREARRHTSNLAKNAFSLLSPTSASSPFQLSPSASSFVLSLSTEKPSPTFSSSFPNGCDAAAAKHNEAERKQRINILSELRNVVELVLSRYKWNNRKPCSSLRLSAKARLDKHSLNRAQTNGENKRKNKQKNTAGFNVNANKVSDFDQLMFQISSSPLYRWLLPEFEILNLVTDKENLRKSEWKVVGNVTAEKATVNTILYIGADRIPDYVMYDRRDEPFLRENGKTSFDLRPLMYMTNSGKHRFRVVTNIAPPFVIESTKLDNYTCLTGDFCLKVETHDREQLITIFTDFRSQRRLYEGQKYVVQCCAGIAIDLLNAVARDLHFDYDLYLVADGLFGVKKNGTWDGITGDLVNDTAHLTFTAFSTTSSRVQAIDYSVPFFYSGVSCLSVTSNETDVPLLAFLIPFSYELWASIFAGLFVTGLAAAIFEWFSPFGLNPWGRQRTKNFSLASALWVMCSLLFSHLVAFKAPKSWPNKVLINVWGAFSVIFLATYTANIAAHFAGLFLVPEVNDFHDKSLMKLRTGTASSSASEGYIMEKYMALWDQIKKNNVHTFNEGLEQLRTGKLDVLIGDTAILDYFRATDPGCSLRLLGDSIFDDAYAVGMQKGFPFRESISNLLLKYNEYGFLDQLHRKWYGRVHCLESSSFTKPKPLTVRAEAGVFLMLGFGIIAGILILLAEHLVFKYFLPKLRKKPKDCFWKSPNLMFFSQKLYRFINTVELVSPHHSAKEIITNLREGQITSLFQKSVKRKAKEEARRRKSKSQFFEMIQEVRKVVQRQQQERSLQEDDDVELSGDHEAMDDIDDEAAWNTNANIRATKPCPIMLKENHILHHPNPKLQANRISSIRFKEPEIFNGIDKNRESGNQFVGNRKNLIDSKQKNVKLDNLFEENGFLTDDIEKGTCRKTNEATRRRREALSKCHLSSNSFSLENIFFEGFFSEGGNDPRKKLLKKRKILSFDDLPAIKKEICESRKYYDDSYSPTYHEPSRLASLDYLNNGLRSRQKKNNFTNPSDIYFDMTSASQENILPVNKTVFTADSTYELNKKDILTLKLATQEELLAKLQSSIDQKSILEQKIALLQQMLKKPP